MKRITLLAVLVIGMMASAQFIRPPQAASLIISGTSNLHDWESKATQVNISGKFDAANGSFRGVEGLVVQVPVKSIKSEKGKTMDSKTYDALLADAHPTIVFTATSVAVSGNSITVPGNLKIAGKTQPATLKATWKSVSGGIQISGSYALKMTDFGIAPPTALMGTMKTGDGVTLEYSFLLN
jgi:polyisoprenoid-binding protein YceI